MNYPKARPGTKTERFEKMQVGDAIEYPLIELANVRAFASMQGLRLNRKYSTHTDREKGVVTVTRDA